MGGRGDAHMCSTVQSTFHHYLNLLHKPNFRKSWLPRKLTMRAIFQYRESPPTSQKDGRILAEDAFPCNRTNPRASQRTGSTYLVLLSYSFTGCNTNITYPKVNLK